MNEDMNGLLEGSDPEHPDKGKHRFRVTYDIHGSNKEVPLYTNSRTVRAKHEKEAIEIMRGLVGGRNHRVEKIGMAEGMDDYNSIAKELIKRHGKNVNKQHVKDMEGERDDEGALDHDQVMDAVKKHLKEVRLPASVTKSIRQASSGSAQARFIKSMKRGPGGYDIEAKAKKLDDMLKRMREKPVSEQKSMDPRKHGVFQRQPDGKFRMMSQLDLLKQRLMNKHGDKLKKK